MRILWSCPPLYWNGGPVIFCFVKDFNIGINLVDVGGPGGPGGPPGPKIDEIKADFAIYNKPKNNGLHGFGHLHGPKPYKRIGFGVLDRTVGLSVVPGPPRGQILRPGP